MKISNWLRHWWQQRPRSRDLERRRLRGRTEVLEPRLVLTVTPVADWFSAVHAPDLGVGVGTLQGASGTASFVSGDAIVGTWIVQLTLTGLATAHGPQDVEPLIDGFGADFTVLSGLGLPGQVLVQASASTRDVAFTALQHNPLVFAFEPDTYIIGPQEAPQLLPNDTRLGVLSGLDNRDQLDGSSDADIDAPEAWNVVDSKLAPSTSVTQVGSRGVVVGVIDSGIDYTHPDLYLNVWINPGEIPAALRAALVDTDGDGLISFVDLNALANASSVTDRNVNRFIDAGDLLVDPRWANGTDNDLNGFVDDLTGWDFSTVIETSNGTTLSPGDNNPMDEFRHGTHVSGILGATGNNNLGVVGVSWEVSLLPLRFLGADNKGSTSNAIRAINYATMMRTRYQTTLTDSALVDGSAGANIRVTNNSWGGSTSGSAALRDAIAAEGAADILFVAAAGNGNAREQGNNNDLLPFFPANYELGNVISVAAVDRFDQLAPFSNFGVQTVDLAAPGLGILSTVPGGRFGFENGTSMAAPFVSGVAALIASIAPDATATEIRDAILTSVDLIPSLNNRVATGGRLNAFQAVTTDTIHPRASIVVADLADVTDSKAGEVSQGFGVTYRDNVAIDALSIDPLGIDAADVIVTQVETAQRFAARLTFADRGNASERFARYEFTPPGGSWGAEDNGTYLIELADHQIRDTSGNFAAGQRLGTFHVLLTRAGQLNVDDTTDSNDEAPNDTFAKDDQGRRTLRAAIQEANANPNPNTIVLTAGLFRLTRVGIEEDSAFTGDLDITEELTIVGSSNGRTIIDAAGLDRVFDVRPGVTLHLQNVTIIGGLAPSGESGGGIRNAGTLTIDASTLNNNETSGDGGAIVNLTGSSTTLTNVTLSGNRAARGAGAFNSGSLVLLNTTVAANTATSTGGGLFNNSGATTRAKNTLVATNTATTGPDLNGTFLSEGNNLIGIADPSNPTGFTRDVAGNKVGTPDQPLDPKLGPLADNGGVTFTHEPLSGSPAIEAGNNNGAPTTDQRGQIRLPGGVGHVDIGAHEQLFVEIHGVKFHDEDADGLQDLEDTNHNGQLDTGEDLDSDGVLDQEVGLKDFRIYLDLNRNGLRDLDEPSMLTLADGSFAFTRLAPGTYAVMEEQTDGYEQTSPRQLQFPDSTSSTLETGGSPSAVVTADFNGDSFPDLAVANRLSHNVQIFLNTGRGTFLPPLPPISLPDNSAPVALIAGDFTGDGVTDLLVATQADNKLTLLQSLGNGQFSAVTTFALTAGPTALAAGRIDTDTDLDLIVTFGDMDSAGVLLNDGTGVFTLAATLTTGDDPSAAALADFDRDGDRDLVIANRAAGSLTFFANTNGTFSNGRDLNSGGISPQALAVEDFDLDGDLDVIVANNGSAGTKSIALFLNHGNATFAAAFVEPFPVLFDPFAASVTFAGGATPIAVQAADFDGDGALDLAVLNQSTNAISILLNTSATSAGTTSGQSDPTSTLFLGDNTGKLRTLNQTTGVSTVVGAFGTATGIQGLTSRAGDTGFVYGVEEVSTTSRLLKINVTTGAATTFTGFSAATLGVPEPFATAIAISALAPDVAIVAGFNGDSGSAGFGNDFIWRVDVTTGAVLGAAVATTGLNELTYSLDGSTLFGTDGSGRLVTVNPTTGAISIVGSPGLSSFIEGLAFRPSDGALFAIDAFTQDNLVQINPSTGALIQVIGNVGIVGPEGIAFISVSDTTAPTVTNRVPAPNATISTSSTNIDVTFSETVVGVDATDLVLTGTAAASATKGTPTDQGGNTWRFPVSGLVNGTLNVSLAPDANDMEDSAGNDLANVTWSYTVGILQFDYGDAPDTSAGTGTGNYQTLLANGGPSHSINTTQTTLFLGARVDSETNATQNSRSNGDDFTTQPDDEDGLIEPAQDLVLTVNTAPVVRVRATNTTGSSATLYGWIDINRDGVFDNATERTSVTVPTATSNGTFTLTFPTIPATATTGVTYARFRLSADATAANSTGAATGGEVEDYAATITQRSDSTVDSTKTKKIASGTNGGPTLAIFDFFGTSVASLGDLDGDGVTDLAVGAYRDSTGGGNRGAFYVQFMNPNGTVKSSVKIASGVNGCPTLADGDLFGGSVVSLGDLDGDGMTDLAVGAVGDDTNGTSRGAMYVLLLNANGTVKSSVKIASGTNGGPTLANYDQLGFSVASLGDLDGDGVTDLAAGAFTDDTNGTDRGAVYVLLLNANGTVKSSVKIASGTNGGPTLANIDRFGRSVASLGDLDGDGVTDLAVGAFTDDTNGADRGAVYVLLLNANGTVKSSVKIASGTNGGPTLADSDLFGGSVASLGDLDGDGVTDLAIGAFRDNTGGTDRGAVYAVLLNANGTVKSSVKIASGTNGGPTLANNDYFGISVASLGDLDGDGMSELAVGAIGDDTGGTNRGAVHVLFLKPQLFDFGDAPDTGAGTGTGNYQTLVANGGPSHLINTTQTTLFLGARVDSETNATQNSRSNGDDITTLPDDEDGLIEPAQDLLLTVNTAPVVRVRATNATGSAATLYGWIDFNRDGVFDNATERTSVTVPTATSNGTFTLTFPTIPTSTTAGATYARFRLSTDVAAANSTGAATGGEVEDYAATITHAATAPPTVRRPRRLPAERTAVPRSRTLTTSVFPWRRWVTWTETV